MRVEFDSALGSREVFPFRADVGSRQRFGALAGPASRAGEIAAAALGSNHLGCIDEVNHSADTRPAAAGSAAQQRLRRRLRGSSVPCIPAQATTSGTPGVPQPATPLFVENFQNSSPASYDTGGAGLRQQRRRVQDPVPENNTSTVPTAIGGTPEAKPVPIDARWMLLLMGVLLMLAGVPQMRRRR